MLRKHFDSKEVLRALILYGSHTKGTQNKNSDVDILVIFSSKSNKQDKLVISEAAAIEARFGVNVHPVIVSESSFFQMLSSREFNTAKETLNSGVILSGFVFYWQYVLNALK